jgi:predicted small secreted protein
MTTPTNSITRALAFVVGAALALGALSACNTISGAGKDIKSGGKAIERAADTSK